MRQYSYVAYKTQRYVIHDVLMTRRHETIYDELFVFCASVLAANCFRVIPIEDLLPFVQVIIYHYSNYVDTLSKILWKAIDRVYNSRSDAISRPQHEYYQITTTNNN